MCLWCMCHSGFLARSFCCIHQANPHEPLLASWSVQRHKNIALFFCVSFFCLRCGMTKTAAQKVSGKPWCSHICLVSIVPCVRACETIHKSSNSPRQPSTHQTRSRSRWRYQYPYDAPLSAPISMMSGPRLCLCVRRWCAERNDDQVINQREAAIRSIEREADALWYLAHSCKHRGCVPCIGLHCYRWSGECQKWLRNASCATKTLAATVNGPLFEQLEADQPNKSAHFFRKGMSLVNCCVTPAICRALRRCPAVRCGCGTAPQ